MKAALQAAGGRLLYTVKCFWPTLSSFQSLRTKTGAGLADGCDKIKPPPQRMNARAHADRSLGLFTGTNYPTFCTVVHVIHFCCESLISGAHSLIFHSLKSGIHQ